jgi:hypothetical protein
LQSRFSLLDAAMSETQLFLPVILQIVLTLLLYLLLGVRKSRAIRDGQVDQERRALHADAWPDSVQQVNNSIRSQFEIPVLFYVLTLILWQLGSSGVITQSLAWLFVISRYVHAYVHTGSNYVPLRRRVFTLGTVIVAILAVRVLFAL